ncbi:MAG: hypothetical protein QM529_05470 [Hydrotalea sp.]|nr:hypothetical protein [Hydrotalea sp.]
MTIYRLYIDESGDATYSFHKNKENRYLCLLGVIIAKEYYENTLSPKLEIIRELFTDDRDDMPIFHYTDVVRHKKHFEKLNDKIIEKQFNQMYLDFLCDAEISLIAVVIDKEKHRSTYQNLASHPYHYCLDVLLERYIRCLKENNGYGDIMIEARGNNEDNPLKESFNNFFNHGTKYCSVDEIRRNLTAREIKIRRKFHRIIGLEISDMLVNPMRKFILHQYDINTLLVKNSFDEKVLEIIAPKIKRDSKDSIKGYGIKML